MPVPMRSAYLRRGLRSLIVVAALLTAIPHGAAQASPRYLLQDLGSFAPNQQSYSVAINSRGDVLGEVGAEDPQPFVYRSGKITRLHPPITLSNMYVTGMNDSDIITAQAYLSNGRAVGFAIKPFRTWFTWTQLPMPKTTVDDVTIAGIDQHGDIDGVLTLDPNGGQLEFRSALWQLTASGYAAPRLLPMSPGFTAEIAGGIWYQNGISYVAGAQGKSGGQEASIWSPSPAVANLQSQWPFVSNLGGTQKHVFAVGPTWNGGVSSAWVAPINFAKTGLASFGTATILEQAAGYTQAEASGVTVGPTGSPIVIGEIVTAQNSVRAAVWYNDTPSLLQRQIIATSGWTVTEASGINQTQTIAGQATKGSLAHAVILRIEA